MKIDIKEIVIEYGWVVIGNFLLALGVAWFILPNNVLTGGVAGIAIAIEPLLHINTNVIINVLTVLLFLIGSLVLGKKFALKTFLSTICYPLFITLLSLISKDYFIMDAYLATIYGGALMGIGVGLVFRTGASTGGTDIPPLIANKYTHLPLPLLVLITDALTVMLGAAVYGLEAALTGIISVWVSSYMINKTMMMGGHDAKNIMIISEHYIELMDKIHDELERGTTLLEGTGGYSKTSKPVIMVVVSKKQFPILQHLVTKLDPEAFVIITDTYEVQGLGFTYEEEL